MNKIVNTNGLNMRKGAGTNYSVIRVLIKNTELEVYQKIVVGLR